jgi:hypothetical protein
MKGDGARLQTKRQRLLRNVKSWLSCDDEPA